MYADINGLKMFYEIRGTADLRKASCPVLAVPARQPRPDPPARPPDLIPDGRTARRHNP